MLEYLFDSDWNQRSDIESLKSATQSQWRQLQRSKNKLGKEVFALKEKVFKLELIQLSLLRYLQNTPGWDEKTFRDTVIELDLEDGRLDEKIGLPVKECVPKAPTRTKKKSSVRIKRTK